jgi:hypothetical protein
MSVHATQSRNEYVQSRLHILFRRRRDAGLVNLLSFKLSCSVLCNQNMVGPDGVGVQNVFGEEIGDILQLARALPTGYDLATRVCKLKLQSGERERQDLARSREAQPDGTEPRLRADQESQASA